MRGYLKNKQFNNFSKELCTLSMKNFMKIHHLTFLTFRLVCYKSGATMLTLKAFFTKRYFLNKIRSNLKVIPFFIFLVGV